MQTKLSVQGNNFYINENLTYHEYPKADENVKGLLFNARMVQGIFDDLSNTEAYFRGDIGHFDPETNTDAFIQALPAWYEAGLRAVTIGVQGGWPVGMKDVKNIQNNPFGEDGKTFDPAYQKRLDRIITACDQLGMVAIINILYWSQTNHFLDGRAVRNALTCCANHLRDQGYQNIIIDVSNEYNLSLCEKFSLVQKPDGMASLIDLVRKESGGMLVGASVACGGLDKEVVDASDVCIIHGNGMTRGQYYGYCKKVIEMAGGKPILCNEDSPCFTRLDVSTGLHISWGYYNNYEKQIPPCHWGIEEGEDTFFVHRMLHLLGEKVPKPEKDYILMGIDEKERYGSDLHTVRVSAQRPETIDYVSYYVNDVLVDISYDEPFFMHTETMWLGKSFAVNKGDCYRAEITLVNGDVIHRSHIATI